MTEFDTELLRNAAHIHRRPDQGHGSDGWFKPMHVGGTDASKHSGALRRMVRQGLIEKRWWGRAYAYRITTFGLTTLQQTDGSLSAVAAASTSKESK